MVKLNNWVCLLYPWYVSLSPLSLLPSARIIMSIPLNRLFRSALLTGSQYPGWIRSVLGSHHWKNPSWGQWASHYWHKIGMGIIWTDSFRTQEQPSSGLVTHILRVDALPQDVITSDRWLKALWELESFGDPDSDRSVYDKFQETVQFKDGRYEVALP